MSETYPVDENGIRVRLGRDPMMRMEAGDPPAGDAPAGDPPAGDPPANDPPAGDPPEADPFDDKSKDTFDRAYVEKLRAENAKHRTRAQKFESTFADLDEPTTEGLLGLVAALKNGDEAAVPVLESILAELSPKQQEELKDAIDEAPKSLTPEEVQKMMEERDATKAAEQAAQEQFNTMKSEIESLGYSLDESKPNVDTADLFFFLGQQPKDQAPDIKKAHEQVQARKDSIINTWKESVNEKNSRYARVATTGAAPTGDKKPVKTREQAKAAAMEYLANAD